ncbi:MAG: hypothetical protein IT530_02240 [Burkholderiales bacterium]|nr:hypothetical protein [Burkholderiales bacterium]
MTMDLEVARRAFADAFVKVVPSNAKIFNRVDAELGEAAVIHCQWPLKEKGPYSGNDSREITVQIGASALNAFRLADARARGLMLERFTRVCSIRLAEGGYHEQDPSSPAFKIRIDERSLEG